MFSAWIAKLRSQSRGPGAWAAWIVALLLVVVVSAMWILDYEPTSFAVRDVALARRMSSGDSPVRGEMLTSTAIEVLDRVLHKRGGYLSNDLLPPGAWMDNVPNWEWGALVQIRDLAKSLRNDFSRSQTQSTEDPDLTSADNHLNINHEAWMFPAAESEYSAAQDAWQAYLARLGAATEQDTQFYARADNLRNWLALVEKRLGDLSQRLGASVGQVRINTDLAGDPDAEQSTATPAVRVVKTPWTEIDDIFYEARGATWALLHFLRAIEYDFGTVLDKRNAVVSLRQIIRELESTQDPIWSPVILNGEGFGFVANHSLAMASYISRANAAVIDLRMLLERG